MGKLNFYIYLKIVWKNLFNINVIKIHIVLLYNSIFYILSSKEYVGEKVHELA